MDELQQDIERIARLRGVSAIDYAAQARELAEGRRRLTADEVRSVFWIPANPVARDFQIFDELPPASRAALRSLRLQTYSPRYFELLERIGDEKALIAAVQAEEAAIIERRQRRPRHPVT